MHRHPRGTPVTTSDSTVLGREVQHHGVAELGFCDPSQQFVVFCGSQ